MTKITPILVGGLIIGGLWLLTRRVEAAQFSCPYCGEIFSTYEELVAHIELFHPEETPPEPPEIELKIELGKMNVFAAEAGDSLYELTFSLPITNVGDAPAQLQLIWGTKNYFAPEWEEAASRIITIQPGQTYVWTWTFDELIEDYYKGYLTCILYIEETGQSAVGVWV